MRAQEQMREVTVPLYDRKRQVLLREYHSQMILEHVAQLNRVMPSELSNRKLITDDTEPRATADDIQSQKKALSRSSSLSLFFYKTRMFFFVPRLQFFSL